MDQSENLADAIAQAEYLADQPEFLHLYAKTNVPGYQGYGETKPGDKVMIAIDSTVHLAAPLAIAKVLRERGAKVDIIIADGGVDRPITETDELDANIRREPWKGHEDTYRPRRYLEMPWVRKVVEWRNYDLLIQGRAFPIAADFRWEGHAWQLEEQFLDKSNNFPRPLHDLINQKAWDPVWSRGKGAKVRITDKEGTDFSYTLLPDYWTTEGTWFAEDPCIGHLMYHPGPPINALQDAEGVIKGTLTHFSKPFPQLTATLEAGKITRVEGGGAYGEGWRALLEETEELQYDQFPGKGLFWLWEVAVGTNPWVRRPSRIDMVSTGGTEWERYRSGVIHLGFGTAGPSEAENKAGELGWPYGHVHMHLMWPTVEITHDDGTVEVPIRDGRLAALDDPEVRALAAEYGDPEELLDRQWEPQIPGISIPGDYTAYAQNPAPWHLGTHTQDEK
ncbi:hypothetical protein [Microbacterium atlanticum]|uniref:hypothetical protein n=1 Tax=Microbacterium atlanticum TaxID=2782168 RepID=UPI0018875EAC|nr:hypothetical protein [Microbacterium atlanticum]